MPSFPPACSIIATSTDADIHFYSFTLPTKRLFQFRHYFVAAAMRTDALLAICALRRARYARRAALINLILLATMLIAIYL